MLEPAGAALPPVDAPPLEGYASIVLVVRRDFPLDKPIDEILDWSDGVVVAVSAGATGIDAVHGRIVATKDQSAERILKITRAVLDDEEKEKA
jgi:hypothetical protein